MVLPPVQVVAVGQELLRRIRQDGAPDDYVEWVVETLVRRFPRSTRSKIMEMLGLVELKQTRFYQEVYQEGTQAGEAKGRQEGEMQGRHTEGMTLIVRLLQRKVGSLTPAQVKHIQSLSLEQLESLGEALLDFTVQGDLDDWLESFSTG
ncbi:hypothetical protein GlitD10_0346 [Gloeomargarita lithophora Alchichica-D10]|uniref:DUF4351 domain-containing protein n=2 Tax=Gloeomargarita TaxID=1188227 RepID=A0A1J0A9Q8_9CYAN|nr:hypothetical protein GlitD10_0346 [Gloeomargarita lithophora Alchichica-D10]